MIFLDKEVWQKICAAHEARDFLGVIKFQGYMEELLEDEPDDYSAHVLSIFAGAHTMAAFQTGRRDDALIFNLEARRIELLGKMQRFRDQGEAICNSAVHLLRFNPKEAKKYLLRARALGEQHGFISMECRCDSANPEASTLHPSPYTLHPYTLHPPSKTLKP